MHEQSPIEIFTVGHSNHSWAKFVALLQLAEIRVVIDVRTFPRSRFAHFCETHLRFELNDLGIAYIYFGRELGGRGPLRTISPADSNFRCIEYHSVLRQCASFARDQRAVLMCSEHEPLDCHRFSPLADDLASDGLSVRHILRCGRIEDHSQTVIRRLNRNRSRK